MKWRLIDKIRTRAKTGLEPGSGLGRVEQAAPLPVDGKDPGGVVIDGVVWPLAGEPPRAVSKGWGDTSWARSR